MSKGPLLRILTYISHNWFFALGAFFALLISSASNLVVPHLIQRIIDKGIVAGSIKVILFGVLIITAAAVIRAVFTFLQGYWAAKLSQEVAYNLRNVLYSHIQNLSFSYHDRAQTGQLLTRVTNDVELVKGFIQRGFIQLLSAFVMMGGSLAFLIRINARLTLIVIPVMFIILVLFAVFAGIGRPLFVKAEQKLGELNSFIQQNILGIRVVKAFSRSEYEIKRFKKHNKGLYDISLYTGKIFAGVIPAIFLLSNMSTLIVIWSGGFQVLAGHLTIGELVAFQSYLMMTFFPVLMLGMVIMSVSQAGAGAKRIFEVLDVGIEVKNVPGAKELSAVKGNVTFENVSFQYFTEGTYVLKDVSFNIKAGTHVAVLGATGSGKSTIINLIPRFYDAVSGRVMIDGFNVRDVTLESLRKNIGIVLQDTYLFSGTIRENIAYGDPDAPYDEIKNAAAEADADDFIESFPYGYDTVIGEKGVMLSGGQRQRIAIARAILIKPGILILDDSTSHLDAVTEKNIEKAVAGLSSGVTTFTIAQKIKTIIKADIILLMDKGRLEDMGTHEELLERSPLYADIVESQLTGFKEKGK
ncbi:MAG: ABC transporter ATP-binding protein [Spirochaetes bacterium]|nr:ABC transporter ATP-binding protein [Spirochaetota bacterium]